MSKEFDAYYKWLGIPPKDQPPNHYRLLGIEVFEENPEVIEASAERQATYLHEVSAGPNVKESQSLLNEIAAARLCLLDPERKAAYDAKLESKMAANVTVSDLSGSSALDDLPWDNLEGLMTGDPASETSATAGGSSDTLPLPAPTIPASSSGVFNVSKSLAPVEPQVSEEVSESSGIPVRWLAIGGGVALVAVVVVIAILVMSRGDDPAKVSGNPEPPSRGRAHNPPDQPATKPPRDVNKKQDGKHPRQHPEGSETKVELKQGTPQVATNTDNGDNTTIENGNPDKGNPDKGNPDKVSTQLAHGVEPKNDDTVETNGGEEPIVESGPHRTEGFETILPTEVTSSAGTTFEISNDCCVLADGNSKTDSYTFQADSRIPNITALRLEALPHKSIPARGPGRGRSGRFEITEVRLHAAPLDGSAPESLAEISGVVSEDAPGALDKLLDGNENSFWPVVRPGRMTTLVIHMQRPLGNDSGTRLRLELDQRFTLGHFRVSASNDPNLLGKRTPINASLPLFVNVGGKDEEGDGVRWLASRPFDGGSYGHVGGRPLESSSGSGALMSCISGIEAFRVRVADGKYNLALLFCGRWPDDVESRSFTVTIEGGKPQEIKNIPAAGAKEPHNAARLFAPNVEVSDGILDIEFTKKDGETVLNGIMLNKVN